MTTHTFSAFRATDKKNVLTLVNQNSTVTMTFNHIGETLSYAHFDDDPRGLSPVELLTVPQQVVIDGTVFNGVEGIQDIDVGRLEWGAGNVTDVMLIHLSRTEFVFINIAGDPVRVESSEELRSFVSSLTAEGPILSGDLAANQSFSFTRFTDHVSVSENDDVTGTEGDDSYQLGAGDDTVKALGGSDLIDGEDGNDTIFGGDDQDFLYGGKGRDHLYGGASGYSSSFGTDQLFGGAGKDSLFGGPEQSELYGDGGRDKLYLLEGDGVAFGGGGGDKIYLETELFGGAYEMQAYGGKGNDKIFGGNASDYLYGDDGRDVLKGGKRGDFLDGRNGDDRLFGGAGGDQLKGGSGDDKLFGQNGADVFYGGTGADEYYGGKGKDTVSYELSKTGATASLKNDSANAGSAAGDSYQKIENLHGTHYHDHLTGTNGANSIAGFAGDDMLFGGGGADWMSVEDGNNELYGGSGKDNMEGFGIGTNLYYGGGGNDYIWDESNGATVYGGGGADYIQTSKGRDLIFGGAGKDDIHSGKGNDTVAGGGGEDNFYFHTDLNDRLTITDFQDDVDTLFFDHNLYEDKKGDPTSIAAFMDKYAHEVDGDVIFDFNNGNKVVVMGMTKMELVDDLA
ncbi:calcium-binding protein [Neptunicoccus sediminis]|uniref:calcium-binding protein n=1 Tax=Neptunicoccus sediminis TaxID=1892596 RepID=UPI000D525B82|nr:calcium-binding protein [Neptunicoccus sediminis]